MSAVASHFVFLFRRRTVMDSLCEGISHEFPGAAMLVSEDRSQVSVRDIGLGETAGMGMVILIVILTDAAPAMAELGSFARRAQRALIGHERRGFILPVCVPNEAVFHRFTLAELPEQGTFSSEFHDAPIFAANGWMLSLLVDPAQELSHFDWMLFARSANRYGFSVERVPVGIHISDRQSVPLFGLRDFPSFVAVALASERRDVAIDLSYLPVTYNGTTEYATNVSRSLIAKGLDGGAWVVIASQEFRAAFGLDAWGVEIVSRENVDRIFDVVFVPHQLYGLSQLEFVSTIARRYALCMLDVIGLRCDYIRMRTPFYRGVSNVAVRHASAVMALSAAGAEDVQSYYESEGIDLAVEPVLITKELGRSRRSAKPAHVVVIGNQFHHKAIELFLRAFLANPAPVSLKVIADQTTQDNFRDSKNLEVLIAGSLPDADMDYLYANASVVAFPSLYEGFGFPVLEGLLRGKRVLAIDTQVNRELKAAFDHHDLLALFPSHSAMVLSLHTLGGAVEGGLMEGPLRSWADVGEQTLRVLETVRTKPVIWSEVLRRVNEVKNMSDVASVRPERSVVLRDLSVGNLGKLLLKRIARRIGGRGN
jgi:glycosyltransferase involved in cell wall biosynthesis